MNTQRLLPVLAILLLAATGIAVQASEPAASEEPAAPTAETELPDLVEDLDGALEAAPSTPAPEGIPHPVALCGTCGPPSSSCSSSGCPAGKVKVCTTEQCYSTEQGWHNHTSCSSCRNFC